VNRLEVKIDDLRWHVANVGHRSFAITTDYEHAPQPESEYVVEDGVWVNRSAPVPGDLIWVVTCCEDPANCDFVRRLSESEIAEAGRFDLIDKFGVGALIESIKREVAREAPTAWAKVGELDIGEEPA